MAPYRQDWFEFLPSHLQSHYIETHAAKSATESHDTPKVPLRATKLDAEGTSCQKSIPSSKIQGFDSAKFKCVVIEDGANAADAAIDPEESLSVLLDLAAHALGKLSGCL